MDQPGKERGGNEIFPRDSVTITHDFGEISDGPVQVKATDCCFTYIQFQKLYPGDVTARVILGDGRSLKREFTNSKTVRTALVRPDGDLEGEDTTGLVLVGGLGRCVALDIEIADTSTVVIDKDKHTTSMKIVHYFFRLCCDDADLQTGKGLGAKIFPPTPGGQVVKLPLLGIKAVRRDPCPR